MSETTNHQQVAYHPHISTLTRLTVPQLKAGMIVCEHGGRFLVTDDARPSSGHLPSGGVGPTDCAVAPSTCLQGEVRGYFHPGSSWTQQGNQWATVMVETDTLDDPEMTKERQLLDQIRKGGR